MEKAFSEHIEEFKFELPKVEKMLDQDEEFLILKKNGIEKQIRFHDYDEIYNVKGLYEKLFYEELKCNSPTVIANMLEEAIEQEGENIEELRTLDFGAGNGMVAEELSEKGVDYIVGMDLIPEAKSAALRDRPEYYEDYYTVDCCNLSDKEKEKLENHDFNSIVTVAALGFGDIPPQAFAEAFNKVDDGGWCAFNIRDKFVENEDSAFKPVLDEMLDQHIDLKNHHKYTHRLAIDGQELKYYAMVGKKTSDMPLDIDA